MSEQPPAPDRLSPEDAARLQEALQRQRFAQMRLERLVQQLHSTYGMSPADRLWEDGEITRAGP